MTFQVQKIFVPAKLYAPSSGPWYAYFKYRNPKTGKMKPFKRKADINRIKSKTKRRKYGAALVAEINTLLHAGWTPFSEREVNILPLKDSLDQMVELKKSNRRRSWQSYKYCVDLLFKFLKEKKLDYIFPKDFDRLMCRQYCDWMINKKYSGSTFNDHREKLGTLFNMLVDRGVVSENYFKKIGKQEEEVKAHVAFTPDQLKTINEYLYLNNYRLFLFTQFIYFCYLRPVEILRLKVKNINLEERFISVYPMQSKNKRQQTVEIPDDFFPLVQGMDLTDPDLFIFGRGLTPSLKPLGRNRVSEMFKKVKEDLKLPPENTLYSFKHTGNVRAFQNGIDPYSIMRQNRHHSIDETMNYLRSLGLIRNTEFASKMK